MTQYMHRATGSIDTREGWIASYNSEELDARELSASQAFAEDEGKTLIAIVTINGDSIPADSVPQVIQDQPGYSGDGSYIVTKSTSGGYRLYKAVGSNWMDASLQDNDSLSGFSMDTAATLGRKGGSVKSDTKKKSSAENGKLGGRPKKQTS